MARIDVLLRKAKKQNPGMVYVLQPVDGSWMLSCSMLGTIARRFYDTAAEARAAVTDRDVVIVIDL